MASPSEQTVLAPDNPDNFVRPEGNLPTLADLLTLEGRASIFYSYARETDMSARFTQAVEDGEGTTVFVPTNKAVQALARKPHEDPESKTVGISDAEHEAISKSNVQRWVGAHIIPSPNVNFSSSDPYNTLTAGATIAFQAISSKHHPAHEPTIDTDAAHFTMVKGRLPRVRTDVDSAHMAAVKGCVAMLDEPVHQCRRVDHTTGDGKSTCASDRSRKNDFVANTDAAHFASIKGPGLRDSPQPDTDESRLSDVKGPIHMKTPFSTNQPIWKQYELNDGVHIIAKKEASNGVMYLIDGTVPV